MIEKLTLSPSRITSTEPPEVIVDDTTLMIDPDKDILYYRDSNRSLKTINLDKEPPTPPTPDPSKDLIQFKLQLPGIKIDTYPGDVRYVDVDAPSVMPGDVVTYGFGASLVNFNVVAFCAMPNRISIQVQNLYPSGGGSTRLDLPYLNFVITRMHF